MNDDKREAMGAEMLHLLSSSPISEVLLGLQDVCFQIATGEHPETLEKWAIAGAGPGARVGLIVRPSLTRIYDDGIERAAWRRVGRAIQEARKVAMGGEL